LAINVFEGTRHITKFVAIIWIIGWCAAAFYDGRTIYDNCAIAMPIIQKQVELVPILNTRVSQLYAPVRQSMLEHQPDHSVHESRLLHDLLG